MPKSVRIVYQLKWYLSFLLIQYKIIIYVIYVYINININSKISVSNKIRHTHNFLHNSIFSEQMDWCCGRIKMWSIKNQNIMHIHMKKTDCHDHYENFGFQHFKYKYLEEFHVLYQFLSDKNILTISYWWNLYYGYNL